MMVNVESRRGSALLVVLGMLSFMLFSGLAFSVYMRQSRLPTSFLRRASTTRQLAKAALAEAIDQIDLAIGNDPHPGLRGDRGYYADRVDNVWSHRVFFGLCRGNTSDDRAEELGLVASPDPSDSAKGEATPWYVPVSRKKPDDSLIPTVPTFPLEGLAYVPPNLINEVRYYSQRTPTARWHSLWFDSGRYAYTAIDVSDYFDVNRLLADRPRMACGPRRITIAHIFEKLEKNGDDGFNHTQYGSGAQDWETFMDKYRTVNEDDDSIVYKRYPFVSLADFNIAFGSQEIGGFRSPFQNIFANAKGGAPYDCGENDENTEKYRMMTFVTDGWFPIPASTDEKYGSCNLEDPRYQPFRPDDLQRENVSPAPMDIGFRLQYSPAEAQSSWLKAGGNIRIPAPAMVALWDYLDVDSVPSSLCMPTAERTPMVCGVKVSMPGPVDLEVEVTTEGGLNVEGQAGADGWTYATQVYAYKLKVSNLADAQKDMQVLLTYPFRDHGMSDELSRSFNVDGRLSVFLTEGEQKISIRPSSFQSFPKTKDDVTRAEFTDKALVSFPLRQQAVQPQEIVSENRERPCIAKPLMIDPALPGGDFTLAKVTYRWPYQQKDEEGNIKKTNEKPGVGETGDAFLKANTSATVNEGDIGVFPLKQNGELKTATELQEVLANKQSFKLKANVALWLRILDKDQNVVDYVPAWQQDDVNFLRGRSEDRVAESVGGSYCPLLRVVADENTELTYSLAALHGDGAKGSLGSFAITGTKLLVSDPRFNYAPENWFKVSGGDGSGNLDPTEWTSVAEGHARDGGGSVPGDGDIFMATSDAGYMQSIYELAFVPRMSGGLNEDDINTSYQLQGIMPVKNLDDYETFGQEKDHDCMWRTYSMYGTSGRSRDELGELEEMFVSGSGTKVNPYSDSTKVLMAAFANTPHDWRVAATNNDELFKMTTDTFNGKHAWNDYSSDATGKICWDCLEELAEKFKQNVRTQKDWEKAYRELGWGTTDDEHKSLGPITVDQDDAKIYAVDKKFFYGFWRDCFAARQQLFLIFVRAEPMMLGGGMKGQTPPQLGARAVALVWRDPTESKGERRINDEGESLPNPHRTRILFYHQFD